MIRNALESGTMERSTFLEGPRETRDRHPRCFVPFVEAEMGQRDRPPQLLIREALTLDDRAGARLVCRLVAVKPYPMLGRPACATPRWRQVARARGDVEDTSLDEDRKSEHKALGPSPSHVIRSPAARPLPKRRRIRAKASQCPHARTPRSRLARGPTPARRRRRVHGSFDGN